MIQNTFKIKEVTNKWKDIHILVDWKTSYYQSVHTYQIKQSIDPMQYL